MYKYIDNFDQIFKMIIICKLGSKIKKEVNVNPEDGLYVLLELLKLPKDSKLLINGITYSVSSTETFKEVGVHDHTRIFVFYQRIRGGPEHICPQGCGRNIPDGYVSCSDLLKDDPYYFDEI